MLHRPLSLAKHCPSSPGPQDDELPLVLVSIRSANCRVPQPDPNGAEVNAKNLIDFGSLLDQAPNTGKITTAVVLNRLLALQSISHKHLQWSHTSKYIAFFFSFFFGKLLHTMRSPTPACYAACCKTFDFTLPRQDSLKKET